MRLLNVFVRRSLLKDVGVFYTDEEAVRIAKGRDCDAVTIDFVFKRIDGYEMACPTRAGDD